MLSIHLKCNQPRRRPPCRQIPHTLVLEHVSPATRLLEKRRQMFEVQEALKQQKQEYARKVRRPCCLTCATKPGRLHVPTEAPACPHRDQRANGNRPRQNT